MTSGYGLLVLCAALVAAPCSAGEPRESRALAGSSALSSEAQLVADWVMRSRDNIGMPYVIVDKVRARVFVFDAGGRALGSAPALLGLAIGDESVPGIADKPLAAIPPHERTTPAGRFVASMDRNIDGKEILWVDYDSAVSLHRVAAGTPKERRAQRLATPTPLDNRITFGCINVPGWFFDALVKPVFGRGEGIVYVLPETRPALSLFGSHDALTAR